MAEGGRRRGAAGTTAVADGGPAAPEARVSANGHGPPRPRPLHRRRGLPGARAVAGGLLVAAAAVGLFAAYSRLHAGPTRSYVVARHALTTGTRVQPGDLALEPMELPRALSARAFSRTSEVVGTTLIVPLGAGELVQPSALVATRVGGTSRTMSFPVDRTRLGALKQGEQVDVVATYGAGNEAWTTIVLRQTLVVEVDRAKSSLGDTQSVVVTVAVDEAADELALAHAVSQGKVTLVVATGAPAVTGPPPTYRAGGAPPSTAKAP